MIEIPAEPADPELLPPALKAFKAVPPLVTEIASAPTTNTYMRRVSAPANCASTT